MCSTAQFITAFFAGAPASLKKQLWGSYLSGRCLSNCLLDRMVIFSAAEDRNALEVEWVTKWKTLELGKSCGRVQGKFRTPGTSSRACLLSAEEGQQLPQPVDASDVSLRHSKRLFLFFFFGLVKHVPASKY